MNRKYVDCREYPNQIGCTLRISGREDEVLRAATEHAISTHGEKDSVELRDWIRGHMKDEPDTGERRPEREQPPAGYA